MTTRAIAKAFYGAGGFACIGIAMFGIGVVHPTLRMALGFLGVGLFVGAFRPPKKGEEA